MRALKRTGIVWLTLVPPLALAQVANPDTLDERQSRGLQQILAAAASLCTKPPLEEHTQRIELTGDAKASVDRIVTKIVDLGIQGAAKYESGTERGVLHAQLATAIKDGNDCKLELLHALQSLIPGLVPDNGRSGASAAESPGHHSRLSGPNSRDHDVADQVVGKLAALKKTGSYSEAQVAGALEPLFLRPAFYPNVVVEDWN
jgi:hypothetical protein